MTKASQIGIPKSINFLFKSSPGFGKTLAAASFALEGPVYLSYWDKNSPVELSTFFTERRFGSLAKKIIDNIEYDVYGAQNANEYLNKMIDFSRDCRYFAIINDSLTWMTASCVNWSLNFGKANKDRKKIKDVLPEWDEYKVETSIVTQCIDISRTLPCHVIWTAHPLAGIALSGSGNSMRVDRTNPIVSYGSKVASMVPGSFSEIYHFSQKQEWGSGGGTKKYIVNTEAIGDEFAKSPLLGDYIKEFDITDKLFYQVWKELISDSIKGRGIEVEEKVKTNSIVNPFANQETQNVADRWK